MKISLHVLIHLSGITLLLLNIFSRFYSNSSLILHLQTWKKTAFLHNKGLSKKNLFNKQTQSDCQNHQQIAKKIILKSAKLQCDT